MKQAIARTRARSILRWLGAGARTVVSGDVTASTAAAEAEANTKGDRLVTICKIDALYWSDTSLLEKRCMGLMGANDDVIAGLTPAQRDLTRGIIDDRNPAEPRDDGAAVDSRAAVPNARVAAIRAPTRIVHARDEGLPRFDHAEFAAAHIPGARFLAYDGGGHLLVVTEPASVRAPVQRHILERTDERERRRSP